MFWFALGCTVSGLALGWAARSITVLGITSFQIIAVLFGLWMGDVLTGFDVVLWCVSALFLHQGSYLAGVIAVTMLSARNAAPEPSLAEQVDGDLRAMDGLAERIETISPGSTADAKELRDLIKQMRRTLHADNALDTLRRERRRRNV